jgi:hypothetical protein
MGMYEVKTKLLTLISNANSGLSPQTTHVLGNWKTNIDRLDSGTFPVVTIRMINATEDYQWGQKTPTKTNAQYYNYRFTAFVFALTLGQARGIADDIIDYLAEHNKDVTSGILDIIKLSVQETADRHGTQRYFKVVVDGIIITEETLTP